MKRKDIQSLLLYVVIIVVIAAVLSPMFKGVGGQDKPTFDDVVRYFSAGEVAEFHISVDNVLTMKLQNGNEIRYRIANLAIFQDSLGEVITQQMADGTLKGEYEPNTASRLSMMLPLIIIGVIIVGLFIWYFEIGRAHV